MDITAVNNTGLNIACKITQILKFFISHFPSMDFDFHIASINIMIGESGIIIHRSAILIIFVIIKRISVTQYKAIIRKFNNDVVTTFFGVGSNFSSKCSAFWILNVVAQIYTKGPATESSFGIIFSKNSFSLNLVCGVKLLSFGSCETFPLSSTFI